MDWQFLMNVMPSYLKGALTTLEVSLLTIIFATILGYFVALMRMSSIKIVRFIASAYIWILRGTPLMLILFWLYYATPFNITMNAFTAGVIGMTISSTAFKAEIIRSGLQSIDKKELEAADAIGMDPFQKMLRVQIPRMVRIIIPPYMNNCVTILVVSAQVSVIAVQDLMLTAQRTYNSTYKVMETLVVCCLIYLTMTSLAMLAQVLIERKLKLTMKKQVVVHND